MRCGQSDDNEGIEMKARMGLTDDPGYIVDSHERGSHDEKYHIRTTGSRVDNAVICTWINLCIDHCRIDLCRVHRRIGMSSNKRVTLRHRLKVVEWIEPISNRIVIGRCIVGGRDEMSL